MADPGYQYPSTTLSKRVNGDTNYAQIFEGEARKLLYELKNHMQFRHLKQLRMTRLFTDGTEIVAWSFVNPVNGVPQDFVRIDTSRSVFAEGIAGKECTITFIEFPDSVPPMKNPFGVRSGEVQGVDYFKTYYSVEVKNCPNCQDVSWEFTFTYTEPEEPRHWINPATGEEELDNHTVNSLSPPAWGEIIEQDSDGNGTYIIWKAYTESGNASDYSRTGLGIMLLRAIVQDESMVELCRQQQKIDVDCCKKDISDRPVEIWWEDNGDCEPFIMYQGVVYNAICLTPTSIPHVGTAGLIWYACTHPQQPFYGIPEIKGSCLPLKWTLSGPIEFWNSDENDNLIFLSCGEAHCMDTASIKLEDRCGNVYEVRTRPCCVDAGPLVINYVSLVLGCGQSQELWATGGCGPYIWSATKGTIDQDGGLYTAPESNPGCENAVITCTDCCGNSATCTIKLQCGGSTGIAWAICEPIVCSTVGEDDYGIFHITKYHCDGSIYNEDWAFYYGGSTYPSCSDTYYHDPPLPNDCGCAHYMPPGACEGALPHGDLRTPTMIANGCCPQVE